MEDSGEGMAAPVGATIGLRGSGSKVPGIFPTGRGLSLPPDSGVGLGSTEALHRQSTLRPPTLHTTRRKRRAGVRIITDFNLEADLALEGTQRGTPHKRALFQRACGGKRVTDSRPDGDPCWAFDG